MPLVRVTTTGSEIVASAQVSRRLVVTLSEGQTSVLTELGLQVNNLPNAFIWIEQTSGALGAEFSPLFAVDNVWTGTSTPNWKKLTPAQALFPDTPAFFNFRVVANMLTIGITTPALPVGNYVFDCIIAASQ